MKAKHQFKYTYDESCEDFSPVEVIFDIPTGEVTITQMLWNFECYLKACGFVFDGHLEVVDEEKYDGPELEWQPIPEQPIAEKKLKEWNEGIAKLDNEQKMKNYKDARKMSDLHHEATKEIEKNKWVHGMCNPPSPDWKKQKNNWYHNE
jgi:hypothetical protein